ncbi:MAG: GPW/gp25 family protein [Cyclobacteriaceae bacterium]|nr:GPW/gp25 family protein [Cyclobacteriaceae bacterium]
MEDNLPFIGTGWDFPPTFQKADSSNAMTSGREDIENSLKILLTTKVGERIMQPRYGCNMDKLVFEPLDSTLQAYMKDLIETAILYFEPRIILNSVILTPVYNEGKIEIMIDYTIAGTNTRYNYVYPFYQVEGVQTLDY